jgi:hypothetical protein
MNAETFRGDLMSFEDLLRLNFNNVSPALDLIFDAPKRPLAGRLSINHNASNHLPPPSPIVRRSAMGGKLDLRQPDLRN